MRKLIDINDYSKQEEVYNNFEKNFIVKQAKNINQTFEIDENLALSIFKMTPMTNNHKINILPKNITINLKIVFAQKKTN